MKNKTPFYLTTTLPYVNAEPHIGFALEIVQADAVARYKRLEENDVIFNFGTDEHGLKIYRKALEQNKNPQKYCDEYAAKFDDLKNALNLSYTHFVRTTNPNHLDASQEFWRRCLKNGDIYKANYPIKYCVGCELEKTDSELVEGKCLFHPNLKIEVYEEENYFFKFSRYQQPLLDFYRKNPNFVLPEPKFKEIKNFVKSGLQDFSISRIKEKMPWGVDVPDDPEHVMYVWFDALIGYISSLGWPQNTKTFQRFWPGAQVAGKDNLRQQTAIWQAMLMSAKLPNSKQIFIHGFITVSGQKISKSLGNVVNPFELVNKYGTDAVRYFLLAKIHPWADSDFTIAKFEEAYNADLANGLGNLVSRVAKLCETSDLEFKENATPKNIFRKAQKDAFDEYRFNDLLSNIWNLDLRPIDRHVDQNSPWTIKDRGKLLEILQQEVDDIRALAKEISPFLPDTSAKICKQFSGPKIESAPPLFPRLSAKIGS
ncbi:MAG: Methionyl-tRNA synthetase [Microgenomates group bacterium GW2011_GWA2_44_7]|nr:MAG: Methionyl-tRNA synthetase [Microgenomates group bacterium GW2011_GWA2_44_7]KKT78144.1 MAG: Methionyl-tRNA synthetase [Microgenomates group bacterium GW2011_GWB1_44_8]